MVPTPSSPLTQAGDKGRPWEKGFKVHSRGRLGELRSPVTFTEDGNLAALLLFFWAQVFLISLFILWSFNFFSFTNLSMENACHYLAH